MTLVGRRGGVATQYSVVCPAHYNAVSAAGRTFRAANSDFESHKAEVASFDAFVSALQSRREANPSSHINAGCAFFAETRDTGNAYARAITNAYRAHPNGSTVCSEMSQGAEPANQ